MPPIDPYDGADLRADMRDLRVKIDSLAVSMAGLAARNEAQASDVGHFHGRMSDVESRLRLAEKHEENARRIGAIEMEVTTLRTQLQSAAPLSTVNDALRQLADLQITKARIAGLLVGAAAAGGMGGGLVQLLAGALGG